MARSISEIKADITTAFMADATVQEKYGFAAGTSFSNYFSTVSIENILFYIISTAIYLVEQISYSHVSAVQKIINSERGHTCSWYQRMVLNFLQSEQVFFDIDTNTWNTGTLTDTEIENARIIKACAVTEGDFTINDTDYYGLLIKVATTDNNGKFTVLSTSQYNALSTYIGKFKDAGVPVMLINQLGDVLQFNITLWIDYSIIHDLSTAETINDAIRAYLKTLPFNGELTMAGLTDAIMAVNGVELAQITQARVYDFQSGYSEDRYSNIIGKILPTSGYFDILFNAYEANYTAGQRTSMVTQFTYYDSEGNELTL